MIEVRFMPYDHIACFYTSTVFPGGMVCTKSKYEMQVCVSSAALHYLILVCTIIYSGISWTVDPRCGGVLVFGFHVFKKWRGNRKVSDTVYVGTSDERIWQFGICSLCFLTR